MYVPKAVQRKSEPNVIQKKVAKQPVPLRGNQGRYDQQSNWHNAPYTDDEEEYAEEEPYYEEDGTLGDEEEAYGYE